MTPSSAGRPPSDPAAVPPLLELLLLPPEELELELLVPASGFGVSFTASR